jgi:hypothetical protein
MWILGDGLSIKYLLLLCDLYVDYVNYG